MSGLPSLARAAVMLVALIVITGCSDDPASPSEAQISPTASVRPAADFPNITVDPPDHVEAFEASGVVPLGVRGYYVLCGGLTEQGIKGHDTREHQWELPVAEKEGVDLVPVSAVLNITIGDNHIQAELALLKPDGQEIAATPTTLGPDSEPATLDIPRIPGPGTYTVQVRSCNGVNGEYEVDGTAAYGPADT